MKRMGWLVGLLAAGTWAAVLPSAMEAPQPPLPPLGPPPMQLFRQLLETNTAGREAFLQARSPEQRRILEQKLAEYQTLSPAQRELRLALTEVRHYLVLLVHLPAEWRQMYLAQVPERYRPLISDRLKAWNQLNPQTQQELLQHQDLLAYMVRMEKLPPMPQGLLLFDVPPDRRSALETALKRWNQTPSQTQQAMLQRFKEFFQLSPSEQRQVLGALPPEQRQAQEKFLAALARLPHGQREKYTAALNRFLSLPPAEQEQFLRNALTWQTLTPEQRKIVREMVEKVPPLPPLPPGLLQSTGISVGETPPSLPRR